MMRNPFVCLRLSLYHFRIAASCTHVCMHIYEKWTAILWAFRSEWSPELSRIEAKKSSAIRMNILCKLKFPLTPTHALLLLTFPAAMLMYATAAPRERWRRRRRWWLWLRFVREEKWLIHLIHGEDCAKTQFFPSFAFSTTLPIIVVIVVVICEWDKQSRWTLSPKHPYHAEGRAAAEMKNI